MTRRLDEKEARVNEIRNQNKEYKKSKSYIKEKKKRVGKPCLFGIIVR